MINKKLQQKLDSIRSHRVFDITVISVITPTSPTCKIIPIL